MSSNRGDFVAATAHLTQLRASPPLNYDIALGTELLAIELHLRRHDYPAAMAAVDAQLTACTPALDSSPNTDNPSNGSGDAYHTIKLLILKARVYARAGVPLKGFSVALRAASAALRACFQPLLWEAVVCVARVLCALRECVAAVRLLRGVMPGLLEGEDRALAAEAYAGLADGYMGMAGQAAATSRERKENMNKVLECLEQAFNAYSSVKDVDGQGEVLAKRATVMHLSGDLILANDEAAKYWALKKAAKEELMT